MTWTLTDKSQYETIEEIAEATPRAAAIVAAAFLDDRLTVAIESRLHPMSNSMRERLFGERGGLRSATAKADLGYALGLYGQEAHDDLAAIRKIRDRFAHKEEIRDFDHPEIGKFVSGLRLYKRFKDPKTLHKSLGTNEGKFLRCVQILLSYLHSETVANKPELTSPKFLTW
jgi:DNA-binding MltR family transcriptional regulator